MPRAQAGSVGGGKSQTYRYQKPEVAKKTAAAKKDVVKATSWKRAAAAKKDVVKASSWKKAAAKKKK